MRYIPQCGDGFDSPEIRGIDRVHFHCLDVLEEREKIKQNAYATWCKKNGIDPDDWSTTALRKREYESSAQYAAAKAYKPAPLTAPRVDDRGELRTVDWPNVRDFLGASETLKRAAMKAAALSDEAIESALASLSTAKLPCTCVRCFARAWVGGYQGCLGADPLFNCCFFDFFDLFFFSFFLN